MKKVLKSIYALIFILFIIILYEVTSIDSKYINRSTIELNINNIRNPVIKRFVRKVDLYIGAVYFNLSKKKQLEFYDKNLEEYSILPDEIIIPAVNENLTVSNKKKL
tara:strand:+ start:132 stop:452 length:321 start_codon:yes stop_codon:yes gene_type:complete